MRVDGLALVRKLRQAQGGPFFRWAIAMTFTPLCNTDAVSEGGVGLIHAGRSVLLIRSKGGELRAYRVRSPHADMPLNEATFDGKTVTCLTISGASTAAAENASHISSETRCTPIRSVSRAMRSMSMSALSKRRARRGESPFCSFPAAAVSAARPASASAI